MKSAVIFLSILLSSNLSFADYRTEDMLNRASLELMTPRSIYDLRVSATCTSDSLTLKGPEKEFELRLDDKNILTGPTQLKPYSYSLQKIFVTCNASSRQSINIRNVDIGDTMKTMTFESHFKSHAKTGYKSGSYGSSKIPGLSGCSSAKEESDQSALELCYQDGNTECKISSSRKIYSTIAKMSLMTIEKGYCEYESIAKSVDP
jgi:hypothetical protein